MYTIFIDEKRRMISYEPYMEGDEHLQSATVAKDEEELQRTLDRFWRNRGFTEGPKMPHLWERKEGE